jgi:hypothetical protein
MRIDRKLSSYKYQFPIHSVVLGIIIFFVALKLSFFDSGFRYPLPLCAINLPLCVPIFLENEVLTKSACAKTWTMDDFYL